MSKASWSYLKSSYFSGFEPVLARSQFALFLLKLSCVAPSFDSLSLLDSIFHKTSDVCSIDRGVWTFSRRLSKHVGTRQSEVNWWDYLNHEVSLEIARARELLPALQDWTMEVRSESFWSLHSQNPNLSLGMAHYFLPIILSLLWSRTACLCEHTDQPAFPGEWGSHAWFSWNQAWSTPPWSRVFLGGWVNRVQLIRLNPHPRGTKTKYFSFKERRLLSS